MKTSAKIVKKQRVVVKKSTQEKYLKIYFDYSVVSMTEDQIGNKYNLSQQAISKAIKWVVENRMDLPSEMNLQIAIDTIKYRIRQLIVNLEDEKKEEKPRKMIIINLTRALREEQELLLKLQSLLSDVHISNEINVTIIE